MTNTSTTPNELSTDSATNPPAPISEINSLAAAVTDAVVAPQIQFVDFGLHPDIERAIIEMGYLTPTPIQAQAIPIVLTGQDVMGAAQTGPENSGLCVADFAPVDALGFVESITGPAPCSSLDVGAHA